MQVNVHSLFHVCCVQLWLIQNQLNSKHQSVTLDTLHYPSRSCNSSVSALSRPQNWLIMESCLVSSRGTRSFSSPESWLALESTYPPIQWVPGALTPGVNQLGNEGDHSPLSIAEVKNQWRYTLTSPHAFNLWCLIKYRDRCTYSSCTKAVDIADDSDSAQDYQHSAYYHLHLQPQNE